MIGKVFAVIIMLALFAAAGTIAWYFTDEFLRGDTKLPGLNQLVTQFKTDTALKTFGSCSALSRHVESGVNAQRSSAEDLVATPLVTQELGSVQKTAVYSETNVQVRGVDEADIVKTDGGYIYTVGNEMLSIVATDNGVTATLASQTALDLAPTEFFIEGDYLALFGTTTQANRIAPTEPQDSYYPGRTFTVAQLWDITDRTAPTLLRTIEFEGNYHTSRLIDNDLYVVLNTYPEYGIENGESLIPQYRDEVIGGTYGAYGPVVPCDAVAYTDVIAPEQFVTVASFEINDPDSTVNRQVVLGSANTLYASRDRLYIAGVTYASGRFLTLDLPTSEESTTVITFTMDNGDIDHAGNFQVPGHVLNQFSMDEHNDVFRIATTAGQLSREDGGTTNNVYLYNSDLQLIGSVEDLAPGESIYAARFMGDRGYLVTFQKVDPLFALDLSDPRNPTILGKLKIPGYSDYLHPYDENHLIGIGKEAVAAEEGNFAWYQGLKAAVFDVTDPTNPTQLHNIIIGDRGSDSYVLNDHKALLFDRERNLLVFPVLLAELSDDLKTEIEDPTAFGGYTFQGAFVYDLTLENGFAERGRITHITDNETFLKTGYFYYDDGYAVQRSLYVNDTLYTVSRNAILANSLGDLSETARVELCTGDSCTQDLPFILE